MEFRTVFYSSPPREIIFIICEKECTVKIHLCTIYLFCPLLFGVQFSMYLYKQFVEFCFQSNKDISKYSWFLRSMFIVLYMAVLVRFQLMFRSTVVCCVCLLPLTFVRVFGWQFFHVKLVICTATLFCVSRLAWCLILIFSIHPYKFIVINLE